MPLLTVFFALILGMVSSRERRSSAGRRCMASAAPGRTRPGGHDLLWQVMVLGGAGLHRDRRPLAG